MSTAPLTLPAPKALDATQVDQQTRLPLITLLSAYADAHERGWDLTFHYLRTHQPTRLAAIRDHIRAHGFTDPVVLSSSHRHVTDGHLRLCAAWDLGHYDVPVTYT